MVRRREPETVDLTVKQPVKAQVFRDEYGNLHETQDQAMRANAKIALSRWAIHRGASNMDAEEWVDLMVSHFDEAYPLIVALKHGFNGEQSEIMRLRSWLKTIEDRGEADDSDCKALLAEVALHPAALTVEESCDYNIPELNTFLRTGKKKAVDRG